MEHQTFLVRPAWQVSPVGTKCRGAGAVIGRSAACCQLRRHPAVCRHLLAAWPLPRNRTPGAGVNGARGRLGAMDTSDFAGTSGQIRGPWRSSASPGRDPPPSTTPSPVPDSGPKASVTIDTLHLPLPAPRNLPLGLLLSELVAPHRLATRRLSRYAHPRLCRARIVLRAEDPSPRLLPSFSIARAQSSQSPAFPTAWPVLCPFPARLDEPRSTVSVLHRSLPAASDSLVLTPPPVEPRPAFGPAVLDAQWLSCVSLPCGPPAERLSAPGLFRTPTTNPSFGRRSISRPSSP